MNISLREIRNDLSIQVRSLAKGLTGPGGRALLRTAGYEFWEITRESFGANQPNRPEEWSDLSEGYKKRLRQRSFGTPLVPTLLRSGTLMNSIRIRVDNDRYAEIFTTCDYASVHQFGDAFLGVPARPYFPVVNGDLTPYARQRIGDKLKQKIREMILFGV